MMESDWKAARGQSVCVMALTALLLAACSDPTMRSPEIYLNSYAVIHPSQQRVIVCHGYECRLKTGVALSEADMETIGGFMRAGSGSAASERVAIAKTIGWMENRVAPFAGTAEDRDYRDLASGGDPSQLDCIDEAANSTSYLMLLRSLGLLQYHTIGHPISKGFLLDGRYPHVTPVLLENDTGAQYAIDSWILPNGEAPIVMLLEDWKNTSSSDMYRSRHPEGV